MKRLLLAFALALAPAGAALAEPAAPAQTTSDPNASVAAPGVIYSARSAQPASSAQQAQPAQPPAANDMMSQVQQVLSADWRPVGTPSGGDLQAAFQAACTGVGDEITALHTHLTRGMTVAQFRQVRNASGLIILPGHTSSSVVFFPNVQLSWVGGGTGTLVITDVDHGRIDLRDSQGAVLQMQLAQAPNGQALLRISHDNQPVGIYVGCASTLQQRVH